MVIGDVFSLEYFFQDITVKLVVVCDSTCSFALVYLEFTTSTAALLFVLHFDKVLVIQL